MLISKFHNIDVDNKIMNLEDKYNILLPNQYKSFLCKYNGGYTPKTKFKVGKISSDIRGFYGLGNVELSLDTLEIKDWIQNQMLPIASDSFGNFILIGLAIENYGRIYFYNHEADKRIECIEDDFISFLQYCKSDRISEASKKSIKEREEALIAKGKGSVITDSLRQMWQKEIDKYGNMIQEEVIIG